jgi:hypothetical protein
MMNGAITWEALAYFAALAASLGGVWWFIHQRISAVQRDLDRFKLEATKEFIRVDHISKMEERLIGSEVRTLQAIDRLTARIDSLIEQRAKTRTTRA